MEIAILGGTGDLGIGLALRWCKAGHRILIGSRSLPKAQRAVAKLQALRPNADLQAMRNEDAAAAAEVVALTVPAAHQIATLASVRPALQGKVLIDATVPLAPPKVGTVQLPLEGSAGQRAQAFLGDDAFVVTAFHNIAAKLLHTDAPIDCHVLVAGNKKAAREVAMRLVQDAGLVGWHAGPIENSAAAEALTSILIQINRRHKISHSGIKIVGQAGS